jgi:hypothetical protein
MRKEYENPLISQIVGKYFIKLAKLSELLGQAYAGSNATSINFIIDLYSIKNSLLGKDFRYSHEYDLCSLVLDMVSFYKNYFLSIGVHTLFHLVNSNNVPTESRKIYPNYNADYILKMTSGNYHYIEKNLGVLSSIIEFLPDIYYYTTEYEASAIIKTICNSSYIPCIILAKDPYCGLAVAGDTSGKITWLKPRKYKGNDISFICNDSNISDCLIIDSGIASGNFKRITTINSTEIYKILAYVKFPARSMPQATQYRKLAEILNEDRDAVIEYYGNEDLAARATVLNLDQQVYLYTNSSEFAENKNTFSKRHSIEALKHINNKYFHDNPLMLDDLLR